MGELQNYEIDLSLIKPKNVKKSDKYSKAIYKYLKDNPWYRRVWFDESAYDSDSDKYIRRTFDVNKMDLGKLYFGMPDGEDSICISGKCISSLISGSRNAQETYCYIGFENSHYVEVTKEFYEKYIEIGRCIYGHHSYLADTDERFTYSDEKHRKCNWCGLEQHLETKEYSYTRCVWEKDQEEFGHETTL